MCDMKKDWEVKKLGEICEIIGGGTPSKKNDKFYEGTIRWATVRDMKSEVITETEFKITDEAVKKSSTHIIPKKNVVIATRVGLGKICLIENDTAINQDLRGVIPKNSNQLNVGYLFHWFKSISNKIVAEGKGATVQGVTLPFIKNIEIPLPPLPEQKRIVSVLDKCFTAINKVKANAEQNLKNTKELFESYLQGVFLKKGKDWEEKQLGDLCLLITKGSSPKWQGIKYVNKPGILFVTSENVGDRELLLETRKYVEEKFNIKDKKSILKKGDVLTNIVGASIGRTAIYNIDDVANINQAVCILRCNPKLILNTYLMNLLNSQILREIFHDNEVNTARANLSLSFFNKLSVPLPSLKVQQSIVNQLDTLKTQTQKLETVYNKKISDLDELKKSILQEAFRGKLSTEATIKLLRK